MYRYDTYDQSIVDQRVEQFRDQVGRRLSGELSEDEFKPLRLQNGLYLQLHAYMLRVAIPYGLLNSRQLRALSEIARIYDKGYAHFTTRQNLQYNWLRLVDVPDILARLAKVEMHAIQTSGNCVRNITADHFAGIAPDEIADPRAVAELIRQWSTFHPEFAALPRKFKIAVTGATHDRAAIRVHDIGIRLVRRAWESFAEVSQSQEVSLTDLPLLPPEGGELGAQIWVGGGLGRTPKLARVVRDFVPFGELLGYLEAILRVYNRFGRRDNAYKARIKILVDALDIDAFRKEVNDEFKQIKDHTPVLEVAELERISSYFARALPPAESPDDAAAPTSRRRRDIAGLQLHTNRALSRFVQNNTFPHRHPGYAAVGISIKPYGAIPGDASSQQMDALADIADEFSLGELVVTHTQNLILPNVRIADLERLWKRLDAIGLGAANFEKASDIISCPGLDYCSLANARSIPVAQQISARIEQLGIEDELGDLSIKISGCINACGHHHVGNIGILGIDKNGEEHYQLMLGGSPSDHAAFGKIVGPALPASAITDAVESVLRTYLEHREDDEESFLECLARIGLNVFKERLHGQRDQAA